MACGSWGWVTERTGWRPKFRVFCFTVPPQVRGLLLLLGKLHLHNQADDDADRFPLGVY